MLEVLPEKAVMPPLGLITLAALCPPNWNLRLVDEAWKSWRTVTSYGQTWSWWRDDRQEDGLRRFWPVLALGGGQSSRPLRHGSRRALEIANYVVTGEPDGCSRYRPRPEDGTARRLYGFRQA
jgi:hypothetical protein